MASVGGIPPAGRGGPKTPAPKYLRIPFVRFNRPDQEVFAQADAIRLRQAQILARQTEEFISTSILGAASDISARASLDRSFEAAGNYLGRKVASFDELYGGDWKASPFRMLSTFDLLCFSLAKDPKKIFQAIAEYQARGLNYKGWGYYLSLDNFYLVFSSVPSGITLIEEDSSFVKIEFGIDLKALSKKHDQLLDWFDMPEKFDRDTQIDPYNVNIALYSAVMAFDPIFSASASDPNLDERVLGERIVFVNNYEKGAIKFLKPSQVKRLFGRIIKEAGAQSKAVGVLAHTRFLFIDNEKVVLLDDEEKSLFSFALTEKEIRRINRHATGQEYQRPGISSLLTWEIMDQLHQRDEVQKKESPELKTVLETMVERLRTNHRTAVVFEGAVDPKFMPDKYLHFSLYNVFLPEHLFVIERTLSSLGWLSRLLPPKVVMSAVVPLEQDGKDGRENKNEGEEPYKILIGEKEFRIEGGILNNLLRKETRDPALKDIKEAMARELFSLVLPPEFLQEYFTLIMAEPQAAIPDDFRSAFKFIDRHLPWFLGPGRAKMQGLFEKIDEVFVWAMQKYLRGALLDTDPQFAYLEKIKRLVESGRNKKIRKPLIDKPKLRYDELIMRVDRGRKSVKKTVGANSLSLRSIGQGTAHQNLLLLPPRDWEENKIAELFDRLRTDIKLPLIKRALKMASRGGLNEVYIRRLYAHVLEILENTDIESYLPWLVDNRHLFKPVFAETLTARSLKILSAILNNASPRQKEILNKDKIFPFSGVEFLPRFGPIAWSNDEEKVNKVYEGLSDQHKLDLNHLINESIKRYGVGNRTISAWYSRILGILDGLDDPGLVAGLVQRNKWYFYLVEQETLSGKSYKMLMEYPYSASRHIRRPFVLSEYFRIAPEIYHKLAPNLGLSSALELSFEELVAFYFGCVQAGHKESDLRQLVFNYLWEICLDALPVRISKKEISFLGAQVDSFWILLVNKKIINRSGVVIGDQDEITEFIKNVQWRSKENSAKLKYLLTKTVRQRFLERQFMETVSKVNISDLQSKYKQGYRGLERLHLLELDRKVEADGILTYSRLGLDKFEGLEKFRLASKILGVSELSPLSDVQKLYHQLARLFHPDFVQDEAKVNEAVRIFKLLEQAYGFWANFHREHLAARK